MVKRKFPTIQGSRGNLYEGGITWREIVVAARHIQKANKTFPPPHSLCLSVSLSPRQREAAARNPRPHHPEMDGPSGGWDSIARRSTEMDRSGSWDAIEWNQIEVRTVPLLARSLLPLLPVPVPLSPLARAPRLASPHLTCACARGMWGWGSEFDAVRVAWPRLSARTLPPAAVPFPDKRGRARARILGARLGCGLRFDAVLRFFALKDPRSRWLSQGMEEFLLEHEEVLAQVRLPSIALNSLRFDVWLP